MILSHARLPIPPLPRDQWDYRRAVIQRQGEIRRLLNLDARNLAGVGFADAREDRDDHQLRELE